MNAKELKVSLGVLVAITITAGGWVMAQQQTTPAVGLETPNNILSSAPPGAVNRSISNNVRRPGDPSLFNLGLVSGTCTIGYSEGQIMQGACTGASHSDRVVLTAEHGGCTLEMTPGMTGEPTVRLYGYRDHCWINEASGKEVERDMLLGVFVGADGCWSNGYGSVCISAQEADPVASVRPQPIPALTVSFLTGEWEPIDQPACGTAYSLIYKADSTWSQDGNGSTYQIAGDRLAYDGQGGETFDQIRVIDSNSMDVRSQNSRDWQGMRRCTPKLR